MVAEHLLLVLEEGRTKLSEVTDGYHEMLTEFQSAQVWLLFD